MARNNYGLGSAGLRGCAGGTGFGFCSVGLGSNGVGTGCGLGVESFGSGLGAGVGAGFTFVSTVSLTTLPWLTITLLPEALSEISAIKMIAKIGTIKCFIVVDFK